MRATLLLILFTLSANAGSILFVDDYGYVTVNDSDPSRLQVTPIGSGEVAFDMLFLPPDGTTSNLDGGPIINITGAYFGDSASPTTLLAWGVLGYSLNLPSGQFTDAAGSVSFYAPGTACEGARPHYCSSFLTYGVPLEIGFETWGVGFGPDGGSVTDTVSIVLSPEPATIWMVSLTLLWGALRKARYKQFSSIQSQNIY